MKARYSSRLKATTFDCFGYFVVIEYRSRLKTYDLIYYPNKGLIYGPGQYINKIQYRNDDYLYLCIMICKMQDMFIDTNTAFTMCVKGVVNEATLCDALKSAIESPAHSSINGD